MILPVLILKPTVSACALAYCDNELSFVLMSKDYIDIQYKVPTAVLSVLNIIVGISAWYFVILLIQEANLG